MNDDGRGEPFVWDHPMEHLEPETAPADQVRDARMMAVALLNDFANEILHTATRPYATVRDVKVKLYGIGFAMGLNFCNDESVTVRADRLGVCKATLSKISCSWNAAHDLPPSWHQTSAAAITSYAQTRRKVVAASNGSNGTSE